MIVLLYTDPLNVANDMLPDFVLGIPEPHACLGSSQGGVLRITFRVHHIADILLRRLERRIQRIVLREVILDATVWDTGRTP